MKPSCCFLFSFQGLDASAYAHQNPTEHLSWQRLFQASTPGEVLPPPSSAPSSPRSGGCFGCMAPGSFTGRALQGMGGLGLRGLLSKVVPLY